MDLRNKWTALKGNIPLELVFSAILSMVLLVYFSIELKIYTMLILTAGTYFLLRQTLQLQGGKVKAGCAVMSAALTLSLVIGGKIQYPNRSFLSFSLLDIVYALFLFLFFYLAAACLYRLSQSLEYEGNEADWTWKKGIRNWFVVFIGIVICWMPAFLTYYPGCLTRDSITTIEMAVGNRPLDTNSPVFYTMLVKVFYSLGSSLFSATVGVAAFSLFQMTTMAGILAYCLCWLHRKGAPSLIVVFCGLYFVLSQLFSIYAITMWKDILFSGVLLLLSLFVYDIWETEGRAVTTVAGLAKLIILSLLTCFLRNNGTYVVIAMLIILIVCYRRYIKRLLPVSLTVVVAVMLVQGSLYNALGFGKGLFQEAAGIPLQQVACTVAMDGNLTDEQKEYLNTVMPLELMKEQYDPYTSNGIKYGNQFNSDFFNETKGEFIKVWAQMLIPNFKWYVKAYLMETVGYWHPTTKDWITSTAPMPDSSLGITQTDLVDRLTGVSLKPKLQSAADFISIGTMVWIVLFCTGIYFLRKQKGKWLFTLPLWLLWGTNMIAAPTFAEFRYMYVFALFLPFAVIAMFLKPLHHDQCVQKDLYSENI